MKEKRFRGKRFIGMALAAVLTVSSAGTTFAAQTYYDQKTQETVAKGVTYEKSSRMTDAGLQNVHVLTVDLTESTLELKEVESKKEYGLKEPVKQLLKDNGAVAGVNSDFFGLSGSYSAPFGPIMKDGELVSAGTGLNKNGNEYCAFFMDEQGNPFFNYFKMDASFSNGAKTIELASMNKVTSMVFPIYLDRNAMTSTADLDRRFQGLVKMTVQNDTITHMSWKGQTVQVPEDGYLIVMSGDYFTNTGSAQAFHEGDRVSLNVNSSVNLDKVKTAFGGGGLLLTNGQTAPETTAVAKGRQPRTAFGVSRDGKKAIMMVVDGRGESIGATHWEMAVLMREYGAYEAMHLDGGGSSTMAAQTVKDDDMTVKNTVSEGSERRVINGVGVFQNAPEGEIKELMIQTDVKHTMIGKPQTFKVYGLDEYYHRIPIAAEAVEMSAAGVKGTWNGLTFTPSEAGKYSVVASYHGKTAVETGFSAGTTVRLKPAKTSVALNIGQTYTIAMQALDENGFTSWVSPSTNYTVENPAVGVVNGNIFTAKAKGSTNIRCEKDGAVAYINVTVGGAAPVWTPKPVVKKDPMEQPVEKKQDGAFYLNLTGKTAYTGANKVEAGLYNAQKSKVDSAMQKADGIIYGGKNDQNTAASDLNWTGGYRFLSKGGVSIAMVTAANGGINAADPSQWNRFTRDIDGAGNDTILFVMDKTPSDFKSASEANYFRAILNTYVEQGKSVFVVSCSGQGYWASAKDGVRYLNLPDLWTAEGRANPDFRVLRLRVDGTHVTYEAVNIK